MIEFLSIQLSKTSVTDWLMLIITIVYVVATIIICAYNRKSIMKMHEQLEEDRKQQRQNIAIQLYDKRREILSKVDEEAFNSRVDIELLFDDTILELYDTFKKNYYEYQENNNDLEIFEGRIQEESPEDFVEYNRLAFESDKMCNNRQLVELASKFDFSTNSYEVESKRKEFYYLDIINDLSKSSVNKNISKEELINAIKDFISRSIE